MLGKRWLTPTLWFAGLTLVLGPAIPRATAAPTAAEVIRQATIRANQAERLKGAYAYTKVTVTDELAPGGKVREHKQKIWEVVLRNGSSTVRLLEVNGHAPAAADLKKQNENQGNLRELLGGAKAEPDNSDSFLTPELVSRFDFTLIGETTVGGRRAYELQFAPKNPEPPVHRIIDRFLNRISGTLWIDGEEFEVARADFHLRSEVDLLGGVAGCLKRLAYSVTRIRVADGLWVNSWANGDFEGRKLLESLRIRTHSHTSNFRALATG